MSDDKLNELIIAKLNKVDDAVQETKIEIVEIKNDLATHIRRTDLAEENLTKLKVYVDTVKENVDNRLSKFDTWYDRFHFIGWLIAGIISVVEVLDKLHILK